MRKTAPLCVIGGGIQAVAFLLVMGLASLPVLFDAGHAPGLPLLLWVASPFVAAALHDWIGGGTLVLVVLAYWWAAWTLACMAWRGRWVDFAFPALLAVHYAASLAGGAMLALAAVRSLSADPVGVARAAYGVLIYLAGQALLWWRFLANRRLRGPAIADGGAAGAG